MCKINIDRKDLLNFFTSFGKGVTDVRMACAGDRITVEVGFSQYYLRKYISGVTVTEEGFIHIAFLEKAIAFLKATKQDSVTLRQVSPVKPLHIEAGGNKIQLPSTDDILSASKTIVVRKLLEKSSAVGWSEFADVKLNVHADVKTADLISLSGMKGLVSDDSQFKLRVHCGENELGIVAGKAATGRLFTVLPITDSDGPNKTVETFFGKWLPTCLQYLDDGNARFHMGDNELVIFEQDNTLLMILNESDA
tara:strand:- start:20846 stop:21598 length:753 start_codon:yes stop_codon:yes gene_type:complete